MFNPFLNKPRFLSVYSTSILRTLREKEKLLIMSNFVLFPQFLQLIHGWLSAILVKIKIVICQLFQFGTV